MLYQSGDYLMVTNRDVKEHNVEGLAEVPI